MRYRIFHGKRNGMVQHVLVFEKDGQVLRYQLLRSQTVPVAGVRRLEDVTAESLNFTGPAEVSAIATTEEKDPYSVLQAAVAHS